MSSTSVILILGSGPRIGASVADKFARDGYKVAIASRRGTGGTTDKGFLSLKADFAKPESIPALFDAVKAEFHIFPSVIVYNAPALTQPLDKESLLSISAERVALDLNVNTISPYVAAQQAIMGWETLTKETKKTFIYTGNVMNVSIIPVPMFLNLGMGKSASAFWIGMADNSYSDKGFRFFYADERQVDGKIKGGPALDGAAHGEFYAQLASHEEGIPWQATFVKDKGYVQFK